MTAIDASYLQRIDTLLSGGQRLLLGIVGAPGAGKSTLAQALHAHFADISQIVPMDGFHLAQAELERLGRAQRKGARIIGKEVSGRVSAKLKNISIDNLFDAILKINGFGYYRKES